MITVIMPVYNGEKYLHDSIQSILKQSYENFEFLILDDSSMDSSVKIIDSYVKIDNRIKLFKLKKNIGITKSLNFLINKASCDYIARMDADDISHPNRFAKQIKFLKENQDVSVVGSYISLINDKNQIYKNIKYPLTSNKIKKKLKSISCIPHPACMFNSKFLREVGCYRPLLETAEDYDLWTRLSVISNLANIPEYLFYYRVNDDGISKKRAFEQYLKSEFVKKNFNYIKKNQDLINIHKIENINKSTMCKLFYNSEFLLKDIELNEILNGNKDKKINIKFFKILFFYFRHPSYSLNKLFNCITNNIF